MIKSVRRTGLRHEQFQLETLKEKKATQKQLKSKIVSSKFQQVKQKKICLQESVFELFKDELSLDVKEKNDLSLLCRSNDLQKLAKC